MQTKPILAGCCVVRFDGHRYLLNPEEVANFLINCQALGVTGPDALARSIDHARDMLLDLQTPLTDEQLLSMRVLKELATSMRAALFIDPDVAA